MSEPKLISPLLDNFAMGDPISRHDGVRCCPAVKENSDNKYIVKVISIPASQTQLDALLLTGAYKDPAAAMDYFKELADGVIEEAEILQKLSQLEGFLPFEGWQTVPMEDNRLGYDVYIVTTYKRSLEKFMRRNPMTHLGAVNLGLDMCAALAICRNAGYLYVDLQPSNIFISEDKEYRIGDLGFVPLDSLKYASLPSKYRSVYTAPELHDPMATLNTTMDVYAAGLILYQIYNNGELPFRGKAPNEPLPSPLNADYEIAEIIMKACAPDPADRWQDPIDMGQALVAYMQRNVINDVPINPPKAELFPEPPRAEVPDADPAQDPEVLPDDQTGGEDIPEVSTEDQPVSEEVLPEEPDADADIALADLSVPDSDGTSPEEAPVETPSPAEPDDDRRTMVIQNGLAPAKKPRLIIFDEDDEDEEFEDEDLDEEDDPADLEPKPPRKKTGLIVSLVVLILVAALGIGAYFFYTNYYILDIRSISVSGAQNSMVVTVDTDIDTSLLTVVCSDSYGNTKRTAIVNGKASFTDLTPDTMYQIQLEVDGFHQLVGPDYSSFTTAAETKILNLSAVTGTEDGSAVLRFSVEGPEKEWNIVCSTEGEDNKVISFSGHTVTVTGLTVGKTYTLTLTEPTDSLYIVGTTSLEFTASPIVLAQDLAITACSGGKLTAEWTVAEDMPVASWNVTCYGDDGSILTATTQETAITLENISNAIGYTLEVSAAGMTQTVRTSVTANPVTITALNVDDSDQNSLTFTWDFEGEIPENGWRLTYSLDNNETLYVVPCATNSAVITPRVHGAVYHMTIYAADGTTVFNDTHTYNAPNAKSFDRYSLIAKNVTANLLITPGNENWSYKDVSADDYTNSFDPGEKISVLLHHKYDFYLDRDDASVLFVIRDASGNVIPELLEYDDSRTWHDLWVNTDYTDYHYCELDLPKAPKETGAYTLYLYINGYAVCTLEFTINP